MEFKSFSKKADVIGLDIGSSSVKMAHFIQKAEGLSLAGAWIKEIDVTADPAAYDREMLHALQELFSDPALKKSRIIVNINCPQTSIKKMTAPVMPADELREAIKLAAKSHFSFPVDESLLDFEITGDTVEKGIKKYEIVVTACPKKTSDKYMFLLDKAGITPSSFITTSYALQKMAGQLYAADDTARCFIDIGESCAELVIAKGRHLLFSRKINVAGSDFTQALTGVLVSDRGKIQLTLDEAEKIKREVGIPPEASPKIVMDKITVTQVLSLLRSPVEHLISETERCIGYYREEGLGQEIGSVILFGGSASLGGLAKHMSDALGVEVKLGDGLEGLKIEEGAIRDRREVSHRLELAVGAALTGTEGVGLLPLSVRKRGELILERNGVIIAAALALACSLVFYFATIAWVNNLERRIRAARSELSVLRPQVKEAEMQSLVNKILANEPRWEEIYAELGSLIPDSIYLTGLTMRSTIMTMRGIVEADDGERILADFIMTLERGLFNSVKLISTRRLDKGAGTEFEISCWVDYE